MIVACACVVVGMCARGAHALAFSGTHSDNSPFATKASLQAALAHANCLGGDATGVSCVDGSASPGLPIANWNVRGVVDMSGLFNGQSTFDGDITRWDVSSVTDMSAMFQGATAFNQNISSWDVSSVKNMANMFTSAAAFNQDITNWNTAAIAANRYADSDDMFRGATAWLAAYSPLYLWVKLDGPPSLWTKGAAPPPTSGPPGAPGATIDDFPEWGVALVALSFVVSTVTSVVIILRALFVRKVAKSVSRV